MSGEKHNRNCESCVFWKQSKLQTRAKDGTQVTWGVCVNTFRAPEINETTHRFGCDMHKRPGEGVA